MLTNTEYFREAAKYYEKHGCYDDGEQGTHHYDAFWYEEYRRCMQGYKVGDTWITGYHYFYLNHWRMMTNKKIDQEKLYGGVSKTRRSRAERKSSFPAFWDVDYEFFHECEKAERDGQHMLWLKPRGVGASYKAASMCGRNFFLIPESKSYTFAFEKEYLIRDGILNKFVMGRSAINSKHPSQKRYTSAFGKPSDYKGALSDMTWRASSQIDGEEKGYMSEVIGVTFKDDWEKGRGKRGKLVIWEEAGKFPKMDTSWNITRDSVEEGGVTFGLMLGFGTGGSKNTNFEAMERMFYNPKAFNVRLFDNVWDEGMKGTDCGYFTPAYRDIAFKDENGNSLQDKAREHYELDREEAKLSPKPETYLQRKAEKPFSPQEAILTNINSIMPKEEARQWRLKITSNGLAKTMGVPGRVVNLGGDEGYQFKPDMNLTPINAYPHDVKEDLSGCIVQFFPPYKVNGRVPDNLYIIGHDPYAHDQSSNLESLGATYVYMQPNNLVPPGDKIVATYFGRPRTQDEYNRQLFLLSYYYNAKIGFENDRGDVIGYAKRFKMLDRLAEEFELAYDDKLKGSKVKRNFGMHIGSGKDNPRKNQGDKYMADWFITNRAKNENDVPIMNLHTIYCPSTLMEIEQYGEGNFDRMSALRILMYHMKELNYKSIQAEAPKTNYNPDSIWNTKLYA